MGLFRRNGSEQTLAFYSASIALPFPRSIAAAAYAKNVPPAHFLNAAGCGGLECELKMKEEAGVSSRCMPLVQESVSDTCVCCGKPAKKMIYWGVAY